jgi:hypothetical protein
MNASASPRVEPAATPAEAQKERPSSLGGGARTELPRFEPQHYDAGLKPLPPVEAAPGPIDRRENAGPNAKRELEAIRYGMDTLDEDIAACLDQWNGQAGRDAGTVMVGFKIDAKGLQTSWVDSDVEVPFGPRTCFASAVYGIDWSHIVESPVQITHRFSLSADGGYR